MKLRYAIPLILGFGLLLFMARVSDNAKIPGPSNPLDQSFSSIADMDRVMAEHGLTCTAILPMGTFGAKNIEESQVCTIDGTQLIIDRMNVDVNEGAVQNASQVLSEYFSGSGLSMVIAHNWVAVSADADLLANIAGLANTQVYAA